MSTTIDSGNGAAPADVKRVLAKLIATVVDNKQRIGYAAGSAMDQNVRKAAEVFARLATAQEAAQQPQADDKALTEALEERDAASDYIDSLLDEVLGPDRHEWTSAYGHADAMADVRERMAALAQMVPVVMGAAQPLSTCTREAIEPGHHALVYGRTRLRYIGLKDNTSVDWHWSKVAWWKAMWYPHRGGPHLSGAWGIYAGEAGGSFTGPGDAEITHWLSMPASPAASSTGGA